MPPENHLAITSPLCETDIDLLTCNTFAVQAKAKQCWRIESREALEAWHRQYPASPYIVLGGGSNIVLAGDIVEPLLLMRIPGRHIEPLNETEALITAGAGENWHDFVVWTLTQGWCGLENLALIPGTVGASPIQNIGAYGVEMCQHFHALDAFDTQEGRWVTLTAAECQFGYRHSLFKEAQGQRYIIVSVTFILSRKPALVLDYGDLRAVLEKKGIHQPSAMDVCNAVQEIRRQKLPDPAVEPNAGSFFKNPIIDAASFKHFIEQHPKAVYYTMPDGRYKLAAGWLIDSRGWKGRQLGPVVVNHRQALVLINHGGTGKDILAAATCIADDIRRYFGIAIEMEPRVIGVA